jgi:hypothetical protein
MCRRFFFVYGLGKIVIILMEMKVMLPFNNFLSFQNVYNTEKILQRTSTEYGPFLKRQ